MGSRHEKTPNVEFDVGNLEGPSRSSNLMSGEDLEWKSVRRRVLCQGDASQGTAVKAAAEEADCSLAKQRLRDAGETAPASMLATRKKLTTLASFTTLRAEAGGMGIPPDRRAYGVACPGNSH